MLTKILKWILFILLTFLPILLIDSAVHWLIFQASELSDILLFIVILIFSSIITVLFKTYAPVLVIKLMSLPPHKNAAGIIFCAFSILIGIGDFIDYSSSNIAFIPKILIIFQVIYLWGSLAFYGYIFRKQY